MSSPIVADLDDYRQDRTLAFEDPSEDEFTFESDDLLDPATEAEQLLADASVLRSHARLAHVAAASCLGRFLHVAGLGWYRWDKRRFVLDIDDKAVTQAVIKVIGNLAAEALGNKELLADLTKSQSASGLAGVIRIMSTIAGLSADPDELDANPYLLNTPGGVLDLQELEQGRDWTALTLLPHDPAYRMTQITKAKYDPSPEAAVWNAFVDRSLPDVDVRVFLQMSTGLSLIGEQPEHFLPILTGRGRNGKGVYYGAVLHALGEYAAVANPNLFNVDRHATADKPNPALLALKSRRIVFMSETAKSAEMDAARMKALTGGDRIMARGVHSKIPVEFDPSHQLFLVTNHAPQLPADDPAVWERVRLVPWDVVVPPEERDPGLGRKLRQEADAVFAWALAGLQEYFRSGLTPPARITAATDEYKAKQDTVSSFIAERCEDGCSDRDSDSTKTLHMDYQKHCRANGVLHDHILGERDFGSRLDELGYVSKRTGARRFRQGLRVLPDNDEARAESARAEADARVAAASPMREPQVLDVEAVRADPDAAKTLLKDLKSRPRGFPEARHLEAVIDVAERCSCPAGTDLSGASLSDDYARLSMTPHARGCALATTDEED